MKRLDGLVAGLVLLALIAAAAHFSGDREAVSGFPRVIDGDSLSLEGQNIRIAGIDAPELRQTCFAQGRAYRCGDVARQALEGMLTGHLVTCRISGRDRYGRRLASCEAGGEDVGAGLVRRGFALAYGRYEREEAAAREQRLELWSGSFERPSEWRKAHSGRAATDLAGGAN